MTFIQIFGICFCSADEWYKINEYEWTFSLMKNGELWVYASKACTIKDLADAFGGEQIITGVENIEKNDEALITINELNHSIKAGEYYIIRKDYKSNIEYTEPLTSYTAERLTQDEIKQMIENWRCSNK